MRAYSSISTACYPDDPGKTLIGCRRYIPLGMLLCHLNPAPQMGTPLPSLTRARPISRGPACAASAEAKLTIAGQELR
jgi:hypothetical protein